MIPTWNVESVGLREVIDEKEIPKITDGQLQFDNKTYQEILEIWGKRDREFEKTTLKEYLKFTSHSTNMFANNGAAQHVTIQEKNKLPTLFPHCISEMSHIIPQNFSGCDSVFRLTNHNLLAKLGPKIAEH